MTPYKKIANTFIDNIISNSNDTTLKLIWYIASKIQQHDFQKKYDTHTFEEKDIEKQTGIHIKTIRRNLVTMQKTSITFIDELKQENKHISLLPEITIKYNGTIEIDINTKIASQILQVVTKQFTFIDTSKLQKLKYKHSIRLLPLLNTINGYTPPAVKAKILDLEKLNNLFGTSYSRIKMLEVNILPKIKQELDQVSELSFEYENIFNNTKKGRPSVVGIKITPVAPLKKQEEQMLLQKQTLATIVEQGHIKIQNKDILKEIEKLVDEKDYITEMRIFIAYCIDNNKHYPDYQVSFLRHLQNKEKL